MLFLYTTFNDGTDIACKITENNMSILAEKPDEIFGFKTCSISVPNFTISERFGFTDEEMAEIVYFSKNNFELMKECANEKGVSV